MEKKIKQISDFIEEGFSGSEALSLYESQFFTPEEYIQITDTECNSEDDDIKEYKNNENNILS